MKWPLPDISWADSTVMSFFWTISTSAKEGPLLIEILQKIQNKTGDTSNGGVLFATGLNKGGKILDLACNRSKFVAWQGVGLMKNKQQNQNLLFKGELLSTFCNNSLQPTTDVFIARQVERHETSTSELATKQSCTTSWGYLYLIFHSLNNSLEFGMAPTAMGKSTKIRLPGKDTVDGSQEWLICQNVDIAQNSYQQLDFDGWL